MFSHASIMSIFSRFFANLCSFFHILLYSRADGPTFLHHPRTTSGDRLESITLQCVVDSNPPPQYYWTKGASREVKKWSRFFSHSIHYSTSHFSINAICATNPAVPGVFKKQQRAAQSSCCVNFMTLMDSRRH